MPDNTTRAKQLMDLQDIVSKLSSSVNKKLEENGEQYYIQIPAELLRLLTGSLVNATSALTQSTEMQMQMVELVETALPKN